MTRHRPAAWYAERLAEPRAGVGRPRVVIDTDAANEIDDQFALAWARLLAPERLDVLAVYAAPFSFEHRRREWQRALARTGATAAGLGLGPRAAGAARQRAGAAAARGPHAGIDPRLAGVLHAGRRHGAQLRRDRAHLLAAAPAARRPRVPRQCRLPRRRAHAAAIERGRPPPDRDGAGHAGRRGAAVRGGDGRHHQRRQRAAARARDRGAHRGRLDQRLPSHAPHINFSLNLEQDLAATRVLFDSGVPIVYLPGFHVGAQLRLSLPEMERHVQPCGAIGAELAPACTATPTRCATSPAWTRAPAPRG
ncbi:MAG: hypothetical protein MZW92_41140 [Comamonadaceae bacterium]|nr:hypothetical protein [Comamonadaceae bacterium]